MSPLTLALPSRGRMYEQARGFLEGAGMGIDSCGGMRSYRGRLAGMDGVEVVFLRSGEIPASLRSGQSHLGVTGDDLIAEAGGYGDQICRLRGFGFGRACLAVAVPTAWIDVSTMAELEEVAAHLPGSLRVATRYQRLAAEFLNRHGIGSFDIIASQGATEGAVAASVADVIVDIYSSGRTLAANDLKPLDDGEILSSSAALIVSRKADWSDRHLEIGTDMLTSIDARILAEASVVLHHDPDIEPTPDVIDRYGLMTSRSGQMVCPAEHVRVVARQLVARGSASVRVVRADQIFTASVCDLAELIGRG